MRSNLILSRWLATGLGKPRSTLIGPDPSAQDSRDSDVGRFFAMSRRGCVVQLRALNSNI